MTKVHFFARFREVVGREEVEMDIEDSMSLEAFLETLESHLPGVKKMAKDGEAIVAVNQEIAALDAKVTNEDEVAVFPPVSGGTEMTRLQEGDFYIEEEIARVKDSSRNIGGIVTFLGTVRGTSKGEKIAKIEFEDYREMAVKKLAEVRERALEKFDVEEIGIVHRTGSMEVGENIVLIVVGAEHRKDAFSAAEWCIDEIKRVVPLWKKETTESGEVWVEGGKD